MIFAHTGHTHEISTLYNYLPLVIVAAIILIALYFVVKADRKQKPKK